MLSSSPVCMSLSSSRREFLRILAAGAAYSSSALAQSAAAAFRSPYVQDVRADRATICWTSNESGVGSVEYWDDSRAVRTAVARTLPVGESRYRFEAILPKLAPGSSYGYRASMNGERVGFSRFQTPGTAAFEFLAFGDSGTGSVAQAQLAKRMLEHSASFVVHTGDLVYPAGSFESYETLYFAYYEELMRSAPFFPCPGNHDYYGAGCIPYRALHSVPGDTVRAQDHGRYYSFDWGNAHFVSLDTNDSLFEAVNGSGDMLRWLDADLRSSQKFWRIVVLHHSPYAEGAHSGEIEGKMIRQYVSPILEKHGVTLVLNGHEHSYQRSVPIRGISYVTSGGGGAQLHPVAPSPLLAKGAAEHHYVALAIDGGQLHARVLRADGSELDSWKLAPQPTIQAVVDAASFGPELASGGLVSIFGHHLTRDEGKPAADLVTLNGEPLKALLASPLQINVQLPQFTGEAVLSVRAPNGSVNRNITLQTVAPAIFEGALLRSNGTLVTDESPAAPGEVLSVYATGLGTSNLVTVEWNGKALATQLTATPAFPGVSVVTFEVPAAQFSEAQLRLMTRGKRSNAVRVPGR